MAVDDASTGKEMKNLKYWLDGTVLHIEVDLAQTQGLSDTGKSFIIASSVGNREIAQTEEGAPIFMGVNIYSKNEEYVKPPREVKATKASVATKRKPPVSKSKRKTAAASAR